MFEGNKFTVLKTLVQLALLACTVGIADREG